jgi:hypothetical protein
MRVNGSLISTAIFYTQSCYLLCDGPFIIPSDAYMILTNGSTVTTADKYLGPAAIFNQDYGSYDLQGNLVIENGKRILNSTYSVITGFLRTENCTGSPRSLVEHYTGWSCDVFFGYTSCIIGIDSTTLFIGGGGIRLGERTQFRAYYSNVFVNSSFVAEANASLAVEDSTITFGKGASLDLSYDVVFSCFYSTELVISGGSVFIRGDDQPPRAQRWLQIPGLAAWLGASISLSSGNIFVTRGKYFIIHGGGHFRMTGGNLDANRATIWIYVGSTASVEQGSSFLRNGTSMEVMQEGSVNISGGDVVADGMSSFQIYDRGVVRVSGSVILSNQSKIVVFADGVLDVSNGTIFTTPDSFVSLENRNGTGQGLLQGSGRIAGRVENLGGKITFNNATSGVTYLSVDQYNQGPNGTIEIKVGSLYGGGASTVINATGAINLGGSAEITIDAAAAERLKNGSVIVLLSGSTINGQFDTVTITINNASAPCEYRVQQQEKSMVLLFDAIGCSAPDASDSIGAPVRFVVYPCLLISYCRCLQIRL